MNKIFLVSGCSKGLGKAIAENFASKNNKVYAGIRNFIEAKGLIACWEKTFPMIVPVKLDIVSDFDCKKNVQSIINKEGHLDVLINVAAYGHTGATEQFTVEDYTNILNTNTVGAFRLIREVVPFMKSRKSGKIINITSLNGLLALPNFGIYCSSKFALEALGLSLRYELSSSNVWVTNVEPGAIFNKTESGGKLPHISARDRFWVLKKLFVMVTQEEIVKRIEKVVDDKLPPAQMIIGRDATTTTYLQRFLPRNLWDWLLRFIWTKQNEK